MASARPRMTLPPERMTPRERRASVSLASIFALRMFGLFLILPVFAVHAVGLPGGDDPALIGLAMGAYGLTQALLHLPFGAASDRIGRKPVILLGLLLFALGSFVAAGADTVLGLLIGRTIQGAGAISAAVTALIADSTRDAQRTKAMAMVGGSIALSFAASLVIAPALYAAVGMSGLFVLIGLLALLAMPLLVFGVPPAPLAAAATATSPGLLAVALQPELLRMNLGILVLHSVQMAMFVVLPGWLVERAGLPLAQHWQVYLGVTVLSLLLMLPPLFWSERRGRLRAVFLGAIVALLLVTIGFASKPAGLVPMVGLLLVYFAGFNILEASLPSLISRLAPERARGTALGLYNTMQSIGLFIGGAVGGWVQSRWGGASVFALCAGLLVVWLAAAAGQRRWPMRGQTPDSDIVAH